MKTISILLAFLALTISAPGQSKKERKKNKIKSTTEYMTTSVNGKTITYKSHFEEFDRAGHSILSVDYNETGDVIVKETARYDAFNNKVEETVFDVAKKKNTRRTFTYNAMKDLTEEVEYNAAGAMVKKWVHTYDGKGNRVSESVYDGSGVLDKKSTFLYNTKDLKTEKRAYNRSAVLESVKKWEYIYY